MDVTRITAQDMENVIKPPTEEVNEFSPVDNPFRKLIESSPNHPVSILSRSILTGKEKVIGRVTQFINCAYLYTGFSYWSPRMTGENNFLTKYFDPVRHLTNAGGSWLGMGVAVVGSELLAGGLSSMNKESWAKASRTLVPLTAAVLLASANFFTESGVISHPLIGTADVLDAVYGILMIGTSYIGFRYFTDVGKVAEKGGLILAKIKKSAKTLEDKVIPLDVMICPIDSPTIRS